jgi:hypothetical protein
LLPTSRDGCPACDGSALTIATAHPGALAKLVPGQLELEGSAFDTDGRGFEKALRCGSIAIMIPFSGLIALLVLAGAGALAGLITWAVSFVGLSFLWVRPRLRRSLPRATRTLAPARSARPDPRFGRDRRSGVVRGLGATVAAFLSAERGVAVQLRITDGSRRPALQAVRGVEFFLDGDERWLVTDVDFAVLEAAGERSSAAITNATASTALAALGLDWQLEGNANEVIVREGDVVDVWGEPGHFARPQLAGYRDHIVPGLGAAAGRPILIALKARAAGAKPFPA